MSIALDLIHLLLLLIISIQIYKVSSILNDSKNLYKPLSAYTDEEKGKGMWKDITP